MKSFVTGGTGFLGARLVENLIRRGADVRCLVRPTADPARLLAMARESAAEERLSVVRGTLGALLPDALAGCDTLYHVAAAMRGATAVLFLSNVVATRQLIEVAARAGVRRVVLVSSLGVYGTQALARGGTLDEECPLDPRPHLRDPYTYSKVSEELEARDAARKGGLELVVIRPGVIYGPGRDCITSRVGLQLGPVLVRMGGGQRLPYTYVDNCADAVALAGYAEGVDGEAINVVDDEPPTGRQLLRRYRKSVGPLRAIPVPASMIQPLSRACAAYHRYSRGQLPAVITPYKSAAMWKGLRYSNEKAKRLLGWRPSVPFDQGLALTFAALREERQSKVRTRDANAATGSR